MRMPQLVISPSENGLGLRGRCSGCSEEDFDMTLLGREQSETVLRGAFDCHFKTVHLCESVGQAALLDS
ncbi:MAG: hypothetical protein JWO91_398 [Acidobacteriaceae bacterium]|nr:hypothetical protein [Acidobacteriaceae bacterium]